MDTKTVWIVQRHNVAWSDMSWRFVGVFTDKATAKGFCEGLSRLKVWRDSDPGEFEGEILEGVMKSTGAKMWFNVMPAVIDDLVGVSD